MSTNSGSVGEVGVKAGANPTAHTDSATTARRYALRAARVAAALAELTKWRRAGCRAS